MSIGAHHFVNFSGSIIGHSEILRLLDDAAAHDRVRHAYLFHGPARVGKTTVARWLAMRLLCQQSPAPCGVCPSCDRIIRAVNPDVRSIQAPGEKGEPIGLPLLPLEGNKRTTSRDIGKDLVESLQHDAAMASPESARKIYFIVGAENLSLVAANQLLKTLEEPPRNVSIVLTASEPNDLLPTVVSRCQLIRFALVPIVEIAEGLERLERCPPDRAKTLSRLAGGRPGWAIDALATPDLLDVRDRMLDDLTTATARGYRERFGIAEKLAATYSRDQSGVLDTLSLWQVWWWDVYLTQIGCSELVTNVDRIDRIRSVAGSVETPRVLRYLKELAVASLRHTQNVNARLALETLLLSSPGAQ